MPYAPSVFKKSLLAALGGGGQRLLLRKPFRPRAAAVREARPATRRTGAKPVMSGVLPRANASRSTARSTMKSSTNRARNWRSTGTMSRPSRFSRPPRTGTTRASSTISATASASSDSSTRAFATTPRPWRSIRTMCAPESISARVTWRPANSRRPGSNCRKSNRDAGTGCEEYQQLARVIAEAG